MMLRRTKAQCLDLPPKVHRTSIVEPSEASKTEYNKLFANMKAQHSKPGGGRRGGGGNAG
eukprot:CAMPEP_0197844652 /NCGR_PEP_ID=MMETSP1438-20131217/1651_1 /TAXON_ID=1461541 /ORGANISM="Pterosperma sp., Strain CCMP1384" /LENGTH=59 /DNA_ID=CAMNT_0043455581 /DNA_START=169 /DNA_END=344 /DNA_ORIENTATION=+